MINLKYFSYLLFPKRCAVCNKVLHISYDFCEDCFKTLRPIPEHYANMFISNSDIFKKHGEKIYFDGMAGAYFHSDGSKELIYNYKFYNRSELSDIIALSLTDTFNKYLSDKNIDCVCAVPTSFYGVLQRGFNHTEKICKALCKNISPKYIKLLKQIKRKNTQHKLDAAARRENVKGVWAVKKKYDIRSKNILLIDDIITTGATVNECAKILKSAGAAKVYCMACNINM